jgi:hypothetical protein
MTAMEKAIHTAFSDIQSDETLKKSLAVYQTTHTKVSSLIQWFDKVITETILKDLDKANSAVISKYTILIMILGVKKAKGTPRRAT